MLLRLAHVSKLPNGRLTRALGRLTPFVPGVVQR
jgi:hypothetical protein